MEKIAIRALTLLVFLYPNSVIERTAPASGTILMFYNGPDKAFAAADSRIYTPSTRNVDDSGCKIISLSDRSFFFYSGAIAQLKSTTDGRVVTSANILARQAFLETSRQTDPYARLFESARRWAALMKPGTDEVLGATPRDQLPNEVQLGGFAGLDRNGAPKMILVTMGVTVFDDGRPSKFTYSTSEWPYDVNKREGFGGINAFIRRANEFLDDITPRAKRATAAFETFVRNKPSKDHDNYFWASAVEAAIRWTPTDPRVGGKVDAAVLERGGTLRWIRRKQNCYSEDVPN